MADEEWTEDHWDDLIYSIEIGDVIPIVGPELLSVPAAAGPAISLESHISSQLGAALKLSPATVAAASTVRDIANSYLAAKGDLSTGDAHRRLKMKLSQVMGQLDQKPEAFELLAKIKKLQIFVSVTPDHLLESTLNRVRFGGRSETIVLANAPSLRQADLQVDPHHWDGTAVFYPFGRQADNEFAITEEDTLEFLFGVVSQPAKFENLFQILRHSNLLFLGCNFPDWLTRFWIRTLSGKGLKHGREKLEIVADRSLREDKNLVMFLRRTDIRLFGEGGAEEFVKKLHQHWEAKRGKEPLPDNAPAGRRTQVFVSYSMTTDKPAAEEVNARLKAMGLETWFDASDIESGQPVTAELRRNIERSTLFVPIISRRAAARLDGYYRDEWKTAINYVPRRSEQLPFIHPVIVDDIQPNEPGIPAEFWLITGEPAAGGHVSARFVEGLKALVRKAQQ